MPNDRQAKIAAAKSPHRKSSGTILAVVIAIVVVVGVIVAIVLGNRSGGGDNAAPDASTAGPETSVTLPRGVADANAPVVATNGGVLKQGIPTLQVFEDFQCPACKNAEDAFGATIKDMGTKGQVNVVYYLKTFLDDSLRNDSSKAAANAALCASDAGKFEDFHDKIYAAQPKNEGDGYTAAQIEQAATGAGIEGAALLTWKQCVADKPYLPYLKGIEDYTSRTMRVTGTPSFYVNSKRMDLTGLGSADDFKKRVLETATK
ncbi:MAG: thioredoxin domain-containing protein [Dermatophilaceae bacterium]